ncbi:MAG: tryptophan synthase subunit alpha [Candidatus Binataceae bacterium]
MAHRGRIARKFVELRRRNEAALIPFIVAGDPDMASTRRLVLELESRGADLIELGVPFSDPMADGPANQRAVARGLSTGASLAGILSMVTDLRKETQIPIVLFGYYNLYLHYGCERLCRDAATAGVDAFLAIDLPPEESAELHKPARANGLDLIYLLAPTTPLERSRRIARSASGFLYYISVTGVTGARGVVGGDVEGKVRELRSVSDLPIGVGFGISTPDQAAKVASFADAVVVGSAISTVIEEHIPAGDVVDAVGSLVGSMKDAMRAVRTGASMQAAN